MTSDSFFFSIWTTAWSIASHIFRLLVASISALRTSSVGRLSFEQQKTSFLAVKFATAMTNLLNIKSHTIVYGSPGPTLILDLNRWPQPNYAKLNLLNYSVNWWIDEIIKTTSQYSLSDWSVSGDGWQLLASWQIKVPSTVYFDAGVRIFEAWCRLAGLQPAPPRRFKLHERPHSYVYITYVLLICCQHLPLCMYLRHKGRIFEFIKIWS